MSDMSAQNDKKVRNSNNPFGKHGIKKLMLTSKPKPVAPARVAVVNAHPHLRKPKSFRVELVDIRDHDCHWPSENKPFTFCGHPAVEGRPYCTYHCWRASPLSEGKQRI